MLSHFWLLANHSPVWSSHHRLNGGVYSIWCGRLQWSSSFSLGNGLPFIWGAAFLLHMVKPHACQPFPYLTTIHFSWRRFSYRLSLQFGMSNFWTFLSKITWNGNFHHMVKSLQRTKHALKKYTPSFKSWHRTDPDQTALETPGSELWLFQLITSLYAPFSGTN